MCAEKNPSVYSNSARTNNNCYFGFLFAMLSYIVLLVRLYMKLLLGGNECNIRSLTLRVTCHKLHCLLLACSGINALSAKGFKDTAGQDFMFSTAQTRADSLPASLKNVLLTTSYIRVSRSNPTLSRDVFLGASC
jgi:hypothetical protein